MEEKDKVIIAESGKMRFTNNGETLELILYNGSSYVEVFNKDRAEKLAHQRINFQENIIRFDLEKFGLTEHQIQEDCAQIYETFIHSTKPEIKEE